VALFLLTRYASVASMLTAAGLPLLALAFDEPWPTIAFGIAACVGVIVLHRRNIRRLLNGTESRFRFSRAAGAG
jgi:glycerol-3-phosphate acyltransferase PlsY